MRAIAREHPRVALFTVTYVVVLFGLGRARGSELAVPYLITISVVVAAVARGHRVLRFSPELLWVLSMLGLAHMLGGLVTIEGETLYERWVVPEWVRYDHVVHVFGTGVATLVTWKILRRLAPGAPVTFGLAALAALGGMGFAMLQESIEFVAAQAGGYDVGGFENTGWDLVANVAGATLAAATLLWVARAGRGADRRIEKSAAWVLLVAQAVFVAGFAVASTLEDGHSYLRHPVSRLGSMESGVASLQNGLFAVLGMGLLVFAPGLYVAAGRAVAVMVPLVLSGVSIVAAGLVQCAETCPPPWAGPTLAETAHTAFGGIVIVGAIAAPFLTARALGSDPGQRRYARFSRLAGGSIAAGWVVYLSVGLHTGTAGAAQMLMLVPALAWLAVTAIGIISKPPQPQRPPTLMTAGPGARSRRAA